MERLSLLVFSVTVIFVTSLNLVEGRPVKEKQPRQVSFKQKGNGQVEASFAVAESFGGLGSLGMAQSMEFGPQGMSSSGSSSMNTNIGGNSMSFANSNAQSSRFDPLGGGFSSSMANAAANSFSNPLFSGSNAMANANAFGNQFG